MKDHKLCAIVITIGIGVILRQYFQSKRPITVFWGQHIQTRDAKDFSRLTANVGILDGDPMYAEAVETMKENRKRDTYPEAPVTPEDEQ